MPLPLLLLGGGAALIGFLALSGAGSTWEDMRRIRPRPGSSSDTIQGIIAGDVQSSGVAPSFQDLVIPALNNGFSVFVPAGSSILKDPRIRLIRSDANGPGSEWKLFAKPGDKLPPLTPTSPVVPPSTPPGQGGQAPAPTMPQGGGDAPRPDWWPQGAPWPPPLGQIPSPDSPRPEWWPPSLPWPPPGMGSPTGPQKKNDDDETPPPGAGSYVDAVNKLRGKLGAVDKLNEMSASARDTNPQIADWLSRVADAEFKRQRDKSIALGGTPLAIKSGYNGEPVSAHYGGTFAQLMAANPGKSYDNTDWNVGKVWLLPLDWMAEAKPLPAPLKGSAKAKSVKLDPNRPVYQKVPGARL